ncbi:MAG: toll/interleukin-1 receptor domain-containing protein [Aliarcobacter sp.]|nr:toll/interleukin-1 receptor domain-containing protein [Aliarcobacter sp.]
METNNIKIIQEILVKANKYDLATKLENAYYENELIDNWNGGIGRTIIFVNPKYIMELEKLVEEDIELLIKIFDQMQQEYDEIKYIKFKININMQQNHTQNNELATFWEQGHFKLFISHLAKYKIQATNLKDGLKLYGISGFVAHVDIETSKQWQDEIEKALHTMDALTAILREGFKESNWCDQEVGFAVGKDILIIPIRQGIRPYGFIGKYQAIQGNNTTVQDVAKKVFNTIVKNPKTRNKMLTCLTNLISNSTHIETALKQLEILSEISDLPQELLEQMAKQIENNNVLIHSSDFINKLDVFFNQCGISIILKNKDNISEFIGKIPF